MKSEKLKLLKRIADEKSADAFLVFSPQYHKENYRYLTELNFVGPFAILLCLAKTGETHVLYASDWDVAANEPLLSGVASVGSVDADISGLTRLLLSVGAKTVAVSGSAYITAAVSAAISRAKAAPVSGEGSLELARMQKTDEEIDCMRKAVHLADDAWRVFTEGVGEGLNEYQICANVERYIKRHGAEDCFMLLATGGKDIHGMTPPMMRSARPGDMVRTEITPQVNGFWAQICRTCVKGPANDDQKRAFDIFLESERAGIAAVRPGVNISDVAKAENDVFRKYGYGEYCTEKYTRVRGHGHGLDLDEMPLVLESTDLVLRENMVVVIHPNTFSPLCGYMVFGDPVLITRDGCELLSTTERKLFEV